MNDVIQSNPYRTPEADLGLDSDQSEYRYAGFWIRLLAMIIDTLIIMMITLPLLYLIFGLEGLMGSEYALAPMYLLINYGIPIVFSVALWMKFGGTPGKRMLGLKVLDERTGEHMSLGKSLLRYVGYIAAMLPILIGMIWVAFDKKKKGWHDHIAGSIVVRD